MVYALRRVLRSIFPEADVVPRRALRPSNLVAPQLRLACEWRTVQLVDYGRGIGKAPHDKS